MPQLLPLLSPWLWLTPPDWPADQLALSLWANPLETPSLCACDHEEPTLWDVPTVVPLDCPVLWLVPLEWAVDQFSPVLWATPVLWLSVWLPESVWAWLTVCAWLSPHDSPCVVATASVTAELSVWAKPWLSLRPTLCPQLRLSPVPQPSETLSLWESAVLSLRPWLLL
jgi:hypothetical protein